MNPTPRLIEILYCPKCKVGMDAELSKRAACPRCGGHRKLMLGAERWLPKEGSSGLAEELFANSVRPAKKEVLAHYFPGLFSSTKHALILQN